MIQCATHESYDKPPAIPMFQGSEPKRQKKASVEESIADGMAAISKALSPPTPKNCSGVSDSLGISPGKSIDLRMKNFQQLRYLQQLLQDNVLSQQEYLEQKRNVLDSLRKLS